MSDTEEVTAVSDYKAFKEICDELGTYAKQLAKNPMNDELAAIVIELLQRRADFLYYEAHTGFRNGD